VDTPHLTTNYLASEGECFKIRREREVYHQVLDRGTVCQRGSLDLFLCASARVACGIWSEWTRGGGLQPDAAARHQVTFGL